MDLDPVLGHEQAGVRPVVVLSADLMNEGPAGLVMIAPLTTTFRPVNTRVEVRPPEGGLKRPSQIQPEQIRSVSLERFDNRIGRVSPLTLARVEHVLRILLDIP